MKRQAWKAISYSQKIYLGPKVGIGKTLGPEVQTILLHGPSGFVYIYIYVYTTS